MPTQNNFDPLNYDTIVNQMQYFKYSLGSKANGQTQLLHQMEIPGCYFFKLCFGFYNTSVNGWNSNFLGADFRNPQLNIDKNNNSMLYSEDKYTNYLKQLNKGNADPDHYNENYTNSAFNYLMLNGEYERAEMLQTFISLLSTINSESPWCWQTLSGLGDAVNRKGFVDNSFKVDDERKSITLKCIYDSSDNRIGTLLDLYRSIVWSQQLKKAIVPANLRKFDMLIYIFDNPTISLNHIQYIPSQLQFYGALSENRRTSSKCYELRNCEFDYNSTMTALDTIDNTKGSQFEYTIKIYFDDCYETRYNEFLALDIGDYVNVDSDAGYNLKDLRNLNKARKQSIDETAQYVLNGMELNQQHAFHAEYDDINYESGQPIDVFKSKFPADEEEKENVKQKEEPKNLHDSTSTDPADDYFADLMAMDYQMELNQTYEDTRIENSFPDNRDHDHLGPIRIFKGHEPEEMDLEAAAKKKKFRMWNEWKISRYALGNFWGLSACDIGIVAKANDLFNKYNPVNFVKSFAHGPSLVNNIKEGAKFVENYIQDGSYKDPLGSFKDAMPLSIYNQKMFKGYPPRYVPVNPQLAEKQFLEREARTLFNNL